MPEVLDRKLLVSVLPPQEEFAHSDCEITTAMIRSPSLFFLTHTHTHAHTHTHSEEVLSALPDGFERNKIMLMMMMLTKMR